MNSKTEYNLLNTTDMEDIIKELNELREHELSQIGLTPRTKFQGSQEEHDNQHLEKAIDYEEAIKILSEHSF